MQQLILWTLDNGPQLSTSDLLLSGSQVHGNMRGAQVYDPATLEQFCNATIWSNTGVQDADAVAAVQAALETFGCYRDGGDYCLYLLTIPLQLNETISTYEQELTSAQLRELPEGSIVKTTGCFYLLRTLSAGCLACDDPDHKPGDMVWVSGHLLTGFAINENSQSDFLGWIEDATGSDDSDRVSMDLMAGDYLDNNAIVIVHDPRWAGLSVDAEVTISHEHCKGCVCDVPVVDAHDLGL